MEKEENEKEQCRFLFSVMDPGSIFFFFTIFRFPSSVSRFRRSSGGGEKKVCAALSIRMIFCL